MHRIPPAKRSSQTAGLGSEASRGDSNTCLRSCQAGALAAFQAARRWCPLTQGIGLRPQPWARFSRPVGPATGFVRRSKLEAGAVPPVEPESLPSRKNAFRLNRKAFRSNLSAVFSHGKAFRLSTRSPSLNGLPDFVYGRVVAAAAKARNHLPGCYQRSGSSRNPLETAATSESRLSGCAAVRSSRWVRRYTCYALANQPDDSRFLRCPHRS